MFGYQKSPDSHGMKSRHLRTNQCPLVVAIIVQIEAKDANFTFKALQHIVVC